MMAKPRVRSTDVLVVDDDPHIGALFVDFLTAEGYAVTSAGDAQEALAPLDGGLRPRLVVTDMKMPDLTGAQLADAVRARPQASSPPVALMSGDHDAMEGVDGVVAKLDKPFSVAAVIDLLRQTGSSREGQPASPSR
jgi:CheY-like chemotaxis protein